jgi:excisionase family DNA binding protein
MSIDEAARYLNVTPRTVDRYVNAAALPVHRMGAGPKAHKRFYRSELDAWLRSRCSDTAPARDGAA